MESIKRLGSSSVGLVNPVGSNRMISRVGRDRRSASRKKGRRSMMSTRPFSAFGTLGSQARGKRSAIRIKLRIDGLIDTRALMHCGSRPLSDTARSSMGRSHDVRSILPRLLLDNKDHHPAWNWCLRSRRSWARQDIRSDEALGGVNSQYNTYQQSSCCSAEKDRHRAGENHSVVRIPVVVRSTEHTTGRGPA